MSKGKRCAYRISAVAAAAASLGPSFTPSTGCAVLLLVMLVQQLKPPYTNHSYIADPLPHARCSNTPAAKSQLTAALQGFTPCCCQPAVPQSLRQQAPLAVGAVLLLLPRFSWGCAAADSWRYTRLGRLAAPCTSSAGPASTRAPLTTPAAHSEPASMACSSQGELSG